MVRSVGSSARSQGAERDEIRGAGIRLKTLAVVAVPMVFLLLLSVVVVGQSFNDTRRSGQVVQFAHVSSGLTIFVNALRKERTEALSHRRSPGARGPASMRAQRRVTDSALVKLRSALESSSVSASPALGRAVAAAEAAHLRLPSIRTGVDKSTSSLADAQRSYSEVIERDLALPGLLADAVGDSELAASLRAYGAISHLLESASQERDVTVGGTAAGRFTPDQYVALAASIAAQDAPIDALGILGTPQQKQRLREVVAGPTATKFLLYRQGAVSSGSTRPLVVPAAEFSAAAGKRLSGLQGLQASYGASVTAIADDIRGTAITRLWLIAGLIALGLAFPVAHALVLSRRIVGPLRQLTESAEQIRTELPRMVERMQQPGEDPDITIEPIKVQGGDEVARLAQAFNTVNEVTVQVAIEQAALRGNIAEMFVNVARRNQALLGRQLVFLDRMESDEEDPEVLQELFQIDHLAAQMRRNAESLLVLAGIDATRRLRAPMPLSDVIRTATGEIEGFQRVDLGLDVDPQVTGLRALSVAHLLAELLDNATHFSDPQTRVRVRASFDGDSLVIDIYDDGLGLTPQELVAANHRLASPPATEIAVAQQLGFYVVGRIAQRLDVRVELKTRVAGGTVAVVHLPASLFVDGSLPVAATPREEPVVVPIVTPADEPPQAAVEEAAHPVPVPVTGARQRGSRADAQPAPAPAVQPVLAPVTGARQRRTRPARARKVRESAPPVPEVAPVPVKAIEVPLEVPPEVPLAVQDILPGRQLRRLTAVPVAPAASRAEAPVVTPAVPVTPLPIPQPRAASGPAGAPVDAPAATAPSASSPLAGSPSASPPAAEVPQPQPVHTPVRGNEMARSALAELSQLSSATYTPALGGGEARPAAAAAELSRRTPKPVSEPAPPIQPDSAAGPRSAERIRGHLSGFRAGVERGRNANNEPAPDQENEEQP